MKARYNSATVFTDHYSDVTYVHLQKSTKAQETLEAKQAFERWANQHSVKIKHYHAIDDLQRRFLMWLEEARKLVFVASMHTSKMGRRKDVYGYYRT
jgi:hypothetical protein